MSFMLTCAHCGSTNFLGLTCQGCGEEAELPAPPSLATTAEEDLSEEVVLDDIVDDDEPEPISIVQGRAYDAPPEFPDFMPNQTSEQRHFRSSLPPLAPLRRSEPPPPAPRRSEPPPTDLKTCPSCGVDLPEPVPTFCESCGKKLVSRPSRTPEAELRAESRARSDSQRFSEPPQAYKNCPGCFAELPTPMPNFCDACGIRLARPSRAPEAGVMRRRCLRCGGRNRPEAVTCLNCREKLDLSVPLTEEQFFI
jgi:hypothetical protein